MIEGSRAHAGKPAASWPRWCAGQPTLGARCAEVAGDRKVGSRWCMTEAFRRRARNPPHSPRESLVLIEHDVSSLFLMRELNLVA